MNPHDEFMDTAGRALEYAWKLRTVLQKLRNDDGLEEPLLTAIQEACVSIAVLRDELDQEMNDRGWTELERKLQVEGAEEALELALAQSSVDSSDDQSQETPAHVR